MVIRSHLSRVSDLLVDYECEDFPVHRKIPSTGQLDVTWDDVLWAAVTIGRPNLRYVFRHGGASFYEALFRWSLVRMALQQRGPRGQRLQRTNAFKTLDPTEKGAVNYFLGMVFCKVFAEKLLGTPWLLHLDVFRNQLNPRVLTGRSRPDLVGQQTDSLEWHAFESKGRASPLGDAEKVKAKAQAQRLVSVNGHNCELHVGAITYFKNDVLRFYWRDPEPENPNKLGAIELGDVDHAWGDYYRPITEIIRSEGVEKIYSADDQRLFQIENLDISVGVHSEILHPLMEGAWETARMRSLELQKIFERNGYRPDGLLIKCGPSWKERQDKSRLV